MEKVYEHLSCAERDEIFRLLRDGISRRKIAENLGRSPATISREIRRNSSHIGYLPDTAASKARKRRRNGIFKIDRHPELKSMLLNGLKERWSPEQIATTCYGKVTFCHETIYRYIHHAPWAIKQQLWQFLWREKPRRKKHKAQKNKGKI
ncbi:MAG: helix-turn-helix domain-containing protein [Rickettsiales bacterium]